MTPAPPATLSWLGWTRSSSRSTTYSRAITPIPASATSSPLSKADSKKASPATAGGEQHSAQFSASPDLHNEFVTAVIGAVASSEDLPTQMLNNELLGNWSRSATRG